MSFTLNDPNIPFLPPEIHAAIAQHLDCHDLPHYRLASKLLAYVGCPEMFHTITLRSTLASLARFKRVVDDENLSKLVRVLIWDTTRWRLCCEDPTWSRWRTHCDIGASRPNLAPGQSALYAELQASQQLFEAYLLRLDEERHVFREIRRAFTRSPSGRILPNLEEVHVVKGAYQLENRQVRMLHCCGFVPLTVPLRDCKGDHFRPKLSKRLLSTLRGLRFATSGRNVELARKWRFHGLTMEDWSDINSGYTYDFEVGHQPDITDITISIGRPGMKLRGSLLNSFALSLYRWRNLESLSLDLKNHPKDATGSRGHNESIQNTLKVRDNQGNPRCPKGLITWPKLHTLSLRRMHTTADALVGLVAGNSSTLRNLTLHALTLTTPRTDPPNQHLIWPKVFQIVGATTTLDKATLSGTFKYRPSRPECVDCDDEATAKRMVSLILDSGEYTSPGELREPESTTEIGTI